jgi:hypothetical protein
MLALSTTNRLLFILICMAMSSCKTPEASIEPVPHLNYAKEKQIRLAPPIIQSERVFFEKENPVLMTLGLEGTNIHYTLDGSAPSVNAPLYQEPLLINQSTIIKAIAFHPQYLPSETAVAQYMRLGQKLDVKNIILNRNPHQNYPGSGPAGLLDRKKGSTNFRTPHWMGFDGGTVEAIIEFEKAEPIHRITASLLSDPASWIFLPESVAVYGSKDGKGYTLLSKRALAPTPEGTSNTLTFISTSFDQTSLRFVKVVLQHFDAIPQWHPGKGTPPWLFIDEILIE